MQHLLENFKKKKPIYNKVWSIFHYQTPVKPVEKSLGEETASQGTRSPANCYPALLPGSVQPLWQELLKKVQPALQNNVRHIPGQVDGTHMGQTRQEVKRPKSGGFFSTSAWSPDMILLILRLKMVSTQQIRQRQQFKTFFRSVALGKLG